MNIHCMFILNLGAVLYIYSRQFLYKCTFLWYVQFFRFTVVTSFNSLTIRTELDFKSEYLFRMCSVVTNLVTSLEFQSNRRATTLFHFGRSGDVYVATRIFLLNSTAEGSATNGYVAATERSCQSQAWAGRNVEGLGKTPSLFQTVVLINAACNNESFYIGNFNSPYFRLIFQIYYSIYSFYGNTFDHLFMFLFIMSARE